ncbi:unnamed protein product [Rotaria sp. Silwood2]|nr:unnamed protein product [Rotaria sp. Silwood2]
MSWTDNTHNQLHIEPNTSGIYIDKCYKQFEYLIASCSLINRYHNQLLKRSIDNKSKRSPQVILSFIIGISCFLIGFIIGTVIAIFISIKRQQLNTDIRSLNINNEISNRSNQNKELTKSPTFNSTSEHMFIQREREISDNTSVTLNRYQTFQDQSLKQERKLAIQRSLLSNFAYIKSSIPHNNISGTLSKSKIPLKQQYQVSKNAIHDKRSKSR